MKKTFFAIAVLALLAFAPSAVAFSLPKPKTSKVVVPSSLAGIKANMADSAAQAAWGAGRGDCSDYGDGSGNCNYGTFDSPSGSATLSFYKHKVASAMVIAGQRDGEYLTKAAGPLMAIETVDAVGIGSPVSKLMKAYPDGDVEGSTKESQYTYVLKGKGKATFTFGILGKQKKVYLLAISNGIGG